MPGFGHGPWGHTAFGEWWWSHYVFYDLIPNVYRDADTGFLEKFSESLRPSFDQLRRKIRDFGDLRDPLRARAAVTETQTLLLGKRVVVKGAIEQSGVDGKVLVLGEFSAPTARFTEEDTGKLLTIRRSANPANNIEVTIFSVIDGTTVTVTPRLQIDAGLLRWDMRSVYKDPPNQTTVEVRGGGVDLGKVKLDWLVNDGFASYEVKKRAIFTVPADERRLLTERDGLKNGTVDSQGRLSTPYLFSTADVGKVVFLSGSAYSENNGRFEILGVDYLSPTDHRAVFSRLDIGGQTLLTGAFDSTGSVRYANQPGKIARVWHQQAGLNTPLSVSVSGNDITVALATDAYGRVVSTAASVVAAVTADPYASLLVTVTATGAGTGYVGDTAELVDVPGTTLTADAALTWAMLPFGQLVLQGPVPKGVVEVDGIDGTLVPLNATQGWFKTTTSAVFRTGDEGKFLVIRGSAVGNDGVYPIASVPVWGSGGAVLLDGVFAAEPVGQVLSWELRTLTNQPDQLHVEASAPPLLNYLAKDFGIEVDTQENEARQRSWVKYVNQWIDRKGLPKAYEILAAISGYSSVVAQLYNITFDVSLGLPGLNVFEITDLFEFDGSLVDALGPEVTLNSPAGLFSSTHIGRYVRTTGATSGNNNQLFEVTGFIDANNLRLTATGEIPTLPTSPDASNGSIRWSLLRLYTNLAPLRPVFDDFDSDAMAVLIPGFSVDRYCWDLPLIIGGGLTPGVAPGSLNVIATAPQVESSFTWVDGDIAVVESLGIWALTDSQSRIAYLELAPEAVTSVTVGAGNSSVTYVGFDPAYLTTIRVAHVNPGPSNPATTVSVSYGATTDITVTLRTDGGGLVLATAQEVVTAVQATPATNGLVGVSYYSGNGTGLAAVAGFTALAANGAYRTSIASAIPVALGAATLEYVCQPSFSCDYCVSYRVLLELELDTLADESAVALERVFERTLKRLKDVTPAHVELVPRMIQPLTATLSLTATIEPVETLATLYAPLSFLYDETPVDDPLYEVDSPPSATITTP